MDPMPPKRSQQVHEGWKSCGRQTRAEKNQEIKSCQAQRISGSRVTDSDYCLSLTRMSYGVGQVASNISTVTEAIGVSRTGEQFWAVQADDGSPF